MKAFPACLAGTMLLCGSVYSAEAMKRVLTALVLIPLVLLLVFKGNFLFVSIFSAAVAELAAWEFLGMADATGAKTPRVLVLVAIAVLFATPLLLPNDVSGAVLGALSLLLFIVCSFRAPLPRVLPDTAYSVFCLMYVGATLTTLPLISAMQNGPALLLFLFFVVWSGDIAALYVGRSIGRHKLAPSISPNKTWEGSVGSILGSVLVGVGLVFLSIQLSRRGMDWIAYPGQLGRWIFLAVLLNLAAQIGDLVESAVKRGAGVKDSGTLLPGHGGMLDRIDALLLAAPVLWYAQLAQSF
jgi:phosphatidate cytidylyltransferase